MSRGGRRLTGRGSTSHDAGPVHWRRVRQACRGTRGKTPGGGSRSGWLTSAANEVGEARDSGASWDADPVAEVVPEGDAELLAGLGKAKEGVAAVASGVGLGAAADLALGDLAANVVLGAVGGQRD